jgi:hypothetical protein
MPQAIEVKYLGATNHRGSRWKATAAAGSITVGYDYELNANENAEAVAVELAEKYEWLEGYRLEGGQLASGNYVFVLIGGEV